MTERKPVNARKGSGLDKNGQLIEAKELFQPPPEAEAEVKRGHLRLIASGRGGEVPSAA